MVESTRSYPSWQWLYLLPT